LNQNLNLVAPWENVAAGQHGERHAVAGGPHKHCHCSFETLQLSSLHLDPQLASMVSDTQRLVARITAAEAARDATAQQLAALKGQLAAEHAAHAELQANNVVQVTADAL
jgi:hypothetical protein